MVSTNGEIKYFMKPLATKSKRERMENIVSMTSSLNRYTNKGRPIFTAIIILK